MRSLIKHLNRPIVWGRPSTSGLNPRTGACGCGVAPEECRERKLWEECGKVPAGVRPPVDGSGIEVTHLD